MSWNGSMQPPKDSKNVTVMALLSVAPGCKICFSTLATNVDAVWSIFMMRSFGMLCWRTLSVISWRNCDLTSAERDLVITGLYVVTAQKFHPLVQWSNPWSCHFKIHILAESFWVHANQATQETTWMLIPAPAVRRFTRAECNLRLSASSISNDRPLTFPIVDCTLVSPFFFFCSCMELLWLFIHGRTVFSVIGLGTLVGIFW